MPGDVFPIKPQTPSSELEQQLTDKLQELSAKYPGMPNVPPPPLQKPPPVAAALVEEEAPPVSGPRVVQLDPMTLMKIELVQTKRRLNKAEEENLLLLLQSVRKEGAELQHQERNLFAGVVAKLGIKAGCNLRLVDREKGLCAIE